MDLDKNLDYSKSSITRYIDLLSNKGILEFDISTKEYVLADKMLERWLKTKYESMGSYPF